MLMRRSLAAFGITALLSAGVAATAGPWDAPIQEQKLHASDPAAADFFGSAVAISGELAIVGAYGKDISPSAPEVGAAYVVGWNGTGWSQIARLAASDGTWPDEFGWSVAVHGDTAVVGARWADIGGLNSAGAAYVFQRDAGGANNWGQVTKLSAADAQLGAEFGYSVAISGNTILVGAREDDHSGATSLGSAYVFERSGGAWTEVAKLIAPTHSHDSEYFGHSVALEGDTAVVGAHRFGDIPSSGWSGAGAAFVYERDPNDPNVWILGAQLGASDSALGDEFGISIAISGDNIIVGAEGNDDPGTWSGSAYIFGRDEGGAGNWGEVIKLLASDGATLDYFGCDVAISGNTALVGSRNDDDLGSASGSAYVFASAGGVWTEYTKLLASDGAANDQFGRRLALDGSTAIIGAHADDDGGSASGSAYIQGDDPATGPPLATPEPGTLSLLVLGVLGLLRRRRR